MNLNLVTIIGAGTMGRGIAQWFAQCGVRVELTDANSEALQTGLDLVHSSWKKLEQKGKFSASEVSGFKENLKAVALSELSTSSDLVIEAIIENLEIKHKVFLDLDKRMGPKTILASNTSSIPITELATPLSKDRKARFLGLHFFNPATIMKLVEVIKGSETEQKLCDDLEAWFKEKGKKPAQCKDSPGFIVNRVARNFYGEALRIAEKREYSEIDHVLKEVGGFRMGPFELMDLIGIDINYDVTCSVWQAFNKEERFAPHHLQKEMVDKKHLGRKTGQGFYPHE
ncbi:MAG: 3-hydroxybutyryl-CoA dehydrogenase [Halobacteriovorax sp.]|nr:3-hydroxybutyryl-CoA dehydrogenase [Halobacteriovorax sp.]|tara:strand:+ start:57836 stop:58690 length:855 start_codon:yes stop_codon:yes gene_type:complete